MSMKEEEEESTTLQRFTARRSIGFAALLGVLPSSSKINSAKMRTSSFFSLTATL